MNALRCAAVAAAVAALPVGLGACGGGEVAARAGDRVLTAERLADFLTAWRRHPGDTALARLLAGWWVEYQLFADRVVAGDSMLDSATIFDVLWPEARAYVLARWRQQLFADRLPLDSQTLDSVYRAGEYRLIQHVLLSAPERGPPETRERARRRAESLQQRLRRGLSWEAALRESEDLNTRGRAGSVGVLARGQTEPAFDQAAFALEPGGISGGIATRYGYHVARRPPLNEVRSEYHEAVEPLVAQHLDSLHMTELAREQGLTVASRGLERARQAVETPLRFLTSGDVVATFEGGRFTQPDVVRWLAAVPDLVHSELERGTDAQLTAFLERMMRFELLYREALRNGVTPSPAELSELRNSLSERLDELKAVLQVYPPAPGDSSSQDQRKRLASERVDEFLHNTPSDWQRFARVPPRLADRLRERARWAVYPRGIARSVGLAVERSAGAGDARPADPPQDASRVPD